MKQFEAFKILVDFAEKHSALVVSDIGSQSLWLKAAKDRPENLYLSGPMGMSTSVALGVATAQKDRLVIAAIGDGALGMNLTSLCTLSNVKPKNLIVIVLDNGVYEFTKGLPSPTNGVDWSKIPDVFPGFKTIRTIKKMDALDKKLTMNGPHFIHAKVEAGELPPPLGLKAPIIHERFLNSLKKPEKKSSKKAEC